jgi:hypothetical protein
MTLALRAGAAPCGMQAAATQPPAAAHWSMMCTTTYLLRTLHLLSTHLAMTQRPHWRPPSHCCQAGRWEGGGGGLGGGWKLFHDKQRQRAAAKNEQVPLQLAARVVLNAPRPGTHPAPASHRRWNAGAWMPPSPPTSHLVGVDGGKVDSLPGAEHGVGAAEAPAAGDGARVGCGLPADHWAYGQRPAGLLGRRRRRARRRGLGEGRGWAWGRRGWTRRGRLQAWRRRRGAGRGWPGGWRLGRWRWRRLGRGRGRRRWPRGRRGGEGGCQGGRGGRRQRRGRAPLRQRPAAAHLPQLHPQLLGPAQVGEHGGDLASQLAAQAQRVLAGGVGRAGRRVAHPVAAAGTTEPQWGNQLRPGERHAPPFDAGERSRQPGRRAGTAGRRAPPRVGGAHPRRKSGLPSSSAQAIGSPLLVMYRCCIQGLTSLGSSCRPSGWVGVGVGGGGGWGGRLETSAGGAARAEQSGMQPRKRAGTLDAD